MHTLRVHEHTTKDMRLAFVGHQVTHLVAEIDKQHCFWKADKSHKHLQRKGGGLSDTERNKDNTGEIPKREIKESQQWDRRA